VEKSTIVLIRNKAERALVDTARLSTVDAVTVLLDVLLAIRDLAESECGAEGERIGSVSLIGMRVKMEKLGLGPDDLEEAVKWARKNGNELEPHPEIAKRDELFASDTFYMDLDKNPDNGKHGMWLVSGIRHSCVVNGVCTARGALDKAIASGKVGSWEGRRVKYLDPGGPEVFPVD